MASTEDYLGAIREKRSAKQSVQVDFSQLPQDVDAGAIASELSSGLPPEYGQEITARHGGRKSVKLDFAAAPYTAPEPAGPSELGKAAAAAADAIAKPLSAAREAVSKVAVDPRAAAAEVGRRFDAGAATEIPILKEASEFKEQLGGSIADAVARRLAEAKLPPIGPTGQWDAARLGTMAALPAEAVDVALPSIKTVGDAEAVAAFVAGAPALAKVGNALPILGAPLEQVPNAIRRRLGMALKGDVVEGAPVTASNVTPRPQAPVVPPGQLPGPALELPPRQLPGPAAPAFLEGPAQPKLLTTKSPIRGDNFLINEPPMRRVFDPKRGELDVAADPGEGLSAIERRMGLRPEPKPAAPAPVIPAARAPKLTKKAAAELAADMRAAEDPAKLAAMVEHAKADKFSAKQLGDVLNRINVEYQRSYRVAGPDAERTQRAAAALQQLGVKPKPPIVEPVAPAVRAAEGVPVASAPAAAAPVEPARPIASSALPPEYTIDRKAIEKASGKKIYEMTVAEFEAAAPGKHRRVLEDSIERAIMRGKGVPDEVAAEHPQLMDDLQRRWYEESEAAAASGESSTPVLDMIRKGGIDESALKNYGGELEEAIAKKLVRKGGRRLDALAEAAAEAGIIPEYDSHMLIDALNHELRTGRPAHPQRAGWFSDPEAAIPESRRPGQEGAINPVAGGRPPQPAAPTPILDELNKMREVRKPSRTIAEVMRDSARAVQESQQDYLAPLKRFVALAEKKAGKRFTAEENAYMQGSMLPGAQGIVESRVADFERILTPVAKRGLDQDLDAFLSLRQFHKRYRDLQDRIGRHYASGDPELIKEAKEIGARIRANKVNPLKMDPAKIQAGLQELQAKVGPIKYRYLELKAEEVWKLNRELLDMMRDAGLVNQKAYDTVVRRGLDYTPIQVLEHLEAELGGGTGGRKISAEYQDVFRGMEGTDKATRGALPATYDYIARAILQAERNKVAQKVVAMRNVPGMSGQIAKLQPFAKVPDGMEPFYVFENGVRQTYAVPEDVGKALQGLGAKELSGLTKALNYVAGTFKAGATSANIEFIPFNLVRDQIEAAILPRAGLYPSVPLPHIKRAIEALRYPLDMLEGLFHAVRQDEAYREVAKSKALFSTFQKNITPEAFIGDLRPKAIEKEAARRTAFLIPKLVNILEEAPKVAIFRRGRRLGLSPAEAAYDARNFGGSPDFARRGTMTSEVNALYMFYNANVQGWARTVEAMTSNAPPMEQAAKIGTFMVLPAVLLYLRNSENEDYHKLDKTEREKFHIFMLGGRYKNKQGQVVPKYIRIPKSNVEKAVYSTVEGALDEYYNVAGRKGMQRLVDALSSMSPLNLEVDLKRPAASAAASVLAGLNPAIKVPAELAANHDFYRQRPIDSRSQMALHPFAREKATTSETAKLLGRVGTTKEPGQPERGGISPIRIEHAIGGFTGGVGKQALDVGDAIMRRMGKAPADDTKGFERLTKTPIVRRFVGRYEPRASVVEQLREFKQNRSMDVATAKTIAARAIQEYAEQRTPESRQVLRESMREAARVDPEIVRRAVEAAGKQMMREGGIPQAYELFRDLPSQERALFMRQLQKSDDGLALRAQLIQEMRRQPLEQ